MYKIPETTLFLGKNMLYKPQCHSTNATAAELGQQVETPDGTVIITDDQIAGRGQRGNTWLSQPGKNLTFSLVLRPGFLSLKDQFKLNEAVSIGIADYAARKVKERVRIKWPNDILVEEKKICGILIENHVSGDVISFSVVGIGLNVNQPFFPFPGAASLRAFTGKEYLLDRELAELLGDMEARYLELRRGNLKILEKRYLELLYQIGETRRFRTGGEVFQGVITGVNDAGQLTMNVGSEEKTFGIKEILFL